MMGSEGSPVNVLVEIGPHPAIKSPLSQILKSIGKPIPYASSLKRAKDDRESMLQLAWSLFGLNAEIDLIAVNAVDDDVHEAELDLLHGCTAIDLPSYEYTYEAVNYYEVGRARNTDFGKSSDTTFLTSRSQAPPSSNPSGGTSSG